MLPAINKAEEITEHLALNPIKQTLHPKTPKKWTEKFKLLSINSPEVIDNPKSKKIFKLRFSYIDDLKKRRVHTIFFGDRNDFIFTKNKDERVKKILKMKNIDNPFHSDYWSAHLTNKYESLKEGLAKFTEFFIENNNIDLKRKIEALNPEIQ